MKHRKLIQILHLSVFFQICFCTSASSIDRVQSDKPEDFLTAQLKPEKIIEQPIEANQRPQASDQEDVDSDQQIVQTDQQPLSSDQQIVTSDQENVDEAIDYSGWKVFRVEGFRPGIPIIRTADGSSTTSPEYPLLDLEENPQVRVLQEHQEDGYYHIAIDSKAATTIISDLKSRGLSVDDMGVDLGEIIAVTRSVRSPLPYGEVSFDQYLTFQEIENFLEGFTTENSALVSRSVIGRSIEGRKIHMLTITSRSREARAQELDKEESGNQPMTVLSDIIHWSDLRIHDITDTKPSQLHGQIIQGQLQDSSFLNDEKDDDEGSSTSGPVVHSLLDKIVNNIPYGENANESATIKGTYETLKKIISHDEEVKSDLRGEKLEPVGEIAEVTYLVLDKIIKSKPHSEKYKPGRFVKNVNRLSRSLELKDESANSGQLEAPQIPLSSILPAEKLQNETVVNAIQESILILSQEFADPTIASQEELDSLVQRVMALPEVAEIDADQTKFKAQLGSVLKNIAAFINTLIEKKSQVPTGTSEGFSANIRSSGTKPVIFIDGGIHAREWISPAFLLYIATQLVKDQTLLRDIEWRLVPVLNPDGYVYSWKNDRLWRKNRRSGNACRGVDLNRNFGYAFGGSGTSSNSCSQVYKGKSAFSEPESQALRSAVTAVQSRLKGYISVHSYGQMILHPWGSTRTNHPRRSQLGSVGEAMSDAIRAINGKAFRVGSAARILYAAAGGSDDWVISLGVPYSYTFELRDKGRYGFVLPAAQIKPAVKEAYAAIEYFGDKIRKDFSLNSGSTSSRYQSETLYSPMLAGLTSANIQSAFPGSQNINGGTPSGFSPTGQTSPFLYPLSLTNPFSNSHQFLAASSQQQAPFSQAALGYLPSKPPQRFGSLNIFNQDSLLGNVQLDLQSQGLGVVLGTQQNSELGAGDQSLRTSFDASSYGPSQENQVQQFVPAPFTSPPLQPSYTDFNPYFSLRQPQISYAGIQGNLKDQSDTSDKIYFGNQPAQFIPYNSPMFIQRVSPQQSFMNSNLGSGTQNQQFLLPVSQANLQQSYLPRFDLQQIQGLTQQPSVSRHNSDLEISSGKGIQQLQVNPLLSSLGIEQSYRTVESRPSPSVQLSAQDAPGTLHLQIVPERVLHREEADARGFDVFYPTG